MPRRTRRFTVRCRHCGVPMFEAPLVHAQQVETVQKHVQTKHRGEANRVTPKGSMMPHIEIVER